MATSVMEARGIEPRSEPRFETASTCVGDAVYLSTARRIASQAEDKLP